MEGVERCATHAAGRDPARRCRAAPGGDGDDLIWAKHQIEGGDSGLNVIEGQGGNDKMFGGPGRNIVRGGEGDDRLQGGLGRNTIEGGPGDDVLRLRGDGRVNSVIRGGPGNDVVHAMGRSTDRISCGSGFDTVYKEIGDTLSFLGVSSGSFVSNSNVLSRQGFGASSAGSFHLRRANSIRYESPEYRGWQALAQYSPDEAKTPSRNAWLWSLGGLYTSGPLYAALAYEIHNDTFGGSRNVPSALSNASDPNARARDTGLRATVQYRFGDHTVETNVARMTYAERGGRSGRFERYAHTAASLGIDSKWTDPWRTAASYVYAGAGTCRLFDGVPCSTSGLEGHQLALGAAYYFSKRTYVFALYARIWNGRSAQYNNVDGVDVPPGADPQQFALGITYNF